MGILTGLPTFLFTMVVGGVVLGCRKFRTRILRRKCTHHTYQPPPPDSRRHSRALDIFLNRTRQSSQQTILDTQSCDGMIENYRMANDYPRRGTPDSPVSLRSTRLHWHSSEDDLEWLRSLTTTLQPSEDSLEWRRSWTPLGSIITDPPSPRTVTSDMSQP